MTITADLLRMAHRCFRELLPTPQDWPIDVSEKCCQQARIGPLRGTANALWLAR